MNPTNKGVPTSNGVTQLKVNRSPEKTKAEPKMANGAWNRKPPVAPSVYHPQPTPKVLQTKAVKGPKEISFHGPGPSSPNVRAAIPPARASRSVGGVVQRSQKPSNIEAELKTQMGSRYEVEEGVGLTRHRYYGGVSENPQKTILYGDQRTTEACLDVWPHCASYKLEAENFGTWTITFYGRRGELYRGTLQQWPAIGLYPVDMILSESGRKTQNDRFHVGDRVTTIS